MNTAHFEKTQRTAPRRSHADMAVLRAKKGKHNKTQRGKDHWGHLQGTSENYGENRTEATLEHSIQRPKWELL